MRKLLLNPTPLFRKLRQLSMLLTLLLALPQTAWGQNITSEFTGYNATNSSISFSNGSTGEWETYESQTGTLGTYGTNEGLKITEAGAGTITLKLKSKFKVTGSIDISKNAKLGTINATNAINGDTNYQLKIYKSSDLNNPVYQKADFASGTQDITLTQNASFSDENIIVQIDANVGNSGYFYIQSLTLQDLSTPYGLSVAGVAVTSANKNDVLNDGTISFTPATDTNPTNTLTLRGARIGSETTEHGITVTDLANLTIICAGTTSNSVYSSATPIYCSNASCDLTFTSEENSNNYIQFNTNATSLVEGFKTVTYVENKAEQFLPQKQIGFITYKINFIFNSAVGLPSLNTKTRTFDTTHLNSANFKVLSGGGFTFDPATCTLTILDGTRFGKFADEQLQQSAIYTEIQWGVDADLRVVINGDCQIIGGVGGNSTYSPFRNYDTSTETVHNGRKISFEKGAGATNVNLALVGADSTKAVLIKDFDGVSLSSDLKWVSGLPLSNSASLTTDCDIKVGTNPITVAEGKGGIDAGNGKIYFDAANKKMKMSYATADGAIVSNLDELTIEFIGENQVPYISSTNTSAPLTIIGLTDAQTPTSTLSLNSEDSNISAVNGFASVSHTGLNFASKTGSSLDNSATKDAILTSATIYPLWVGGTLVTGTTTSGTDASSGSTVWEYDATNNKLTLTNYTKADNDGHAFISNMANLNVYLVGTNTVGKQALSAGKAFYTTYTDATLTFSTDENNKGTLSASGYDIFCEGFRTVNGIYCNNGLGYFPGTREIKAKATPTISFSKRQQTGDTNPGDIISPLEAVGETETLTTTYGSAFYAPAPTFSNGEGLNDSTRFVYSYSVDGVVVFPNNGESTDNPGKIIYGEISLLKAGTVKITCTFPGNMQNNPCSASYTLQVNKADANLAYDAATSNAYIDLSGNGQWGVPNGTGGTAPTLTKPTNVTGITYTSSNTNVATVSSTGDVTPIGAGSATITATIKDDERYNDATASYTLTVMVPATISFANATASIVNTETYTQTASTVPAGSTITYSSSNNDVNVNANGEVTISNSFYGKATITATVTAVPDADPQYYYVLPDNTAFQATYDLTVSKVFNSVTFVDGQNFATYYNGSENMTVPEGLTAYLITGTSGNSVVTYPINYLPQNVPLLLEKSATASSTLTNTTFSGTELTDAEINSNLLQYAEGDRSVAEIISDGGTPYVLYKNEFVKATGTIPGDHCYLFITSHAPSRGMYSIGDGNDGSTAIDATLIDNEETTNDDWYDLQGRRIQKPTKAGIYIVNGKKMIVK